MKVLHVSGGNLYGGVEATLLTLARFQEACPEMSPAFAFAYDGPVVAELRRESARVDILGGARLTRPWTVASARARLKELITREGYDSVICHSAWPVAVFGPAVRDAQAELALWLHEPISPGHWLWRLARRVRPDRILCNSEFTASSVEPTYVGVPSEVVFYPVAPPPQPTPTKQSRLRRELETPEHATVILQASRMEAWKGHELHFRALGKIRDLPDWVCWVAGGAQRPAEAEYLAKIKRLAAELGVADRIRFMGQRNDVRDLMGAADLHCQPNLGPEPFGIVFVEALFAGIPSITTAMGGAMEIVNGECGRLVPPRDVDALAAALRELIGDQALRDRLGSRGPSRAMELCDPARQVVRIHAALSAARVG